MKKTLLSLLVLFAFIFNCNAQIIITGIMANPSSTDSPYEYVQLQATQAIDFSTSNYTVVFCNNGTATSNGWIAGNGITYNFNLTSGSVAKGDIFYVGGSGKLINGSGSTDISSSKWIKTINTGTTGGDDFGSSNSSGILGNGGSNADGVAVFTGLGSALTALTIPIDAVFFGTGVGSAKPATGGYTVPNNDIYSTAQGTFGNGTNTTVFADAGSQDFIKLSGIYDTNSGTWTSPRTSSVSTLTSISTLIDIENSGTTVLPINLLNFTAKEVDKTILLNWITASEKNNQSFDVLRSFDGKSFTSIAQIAGDGNSDSEKSYSLVDENPYAGVNYYQLKQTDVDGKTRLSNIVSVNSKIENTKISVYSNNSLVTTFVNSPNYTTANLALYNINGKLLANKSTLINKGFNSITFDEVLIPGVYFINYTANGVQVNEKFLK